MNSIWTPSSIEIQELSKPTIFTVWLYNKALEREQKTQSLLDKKALENKKQIEKNSIVEKVASMNAILINQTTKSKTEIRMNNDGSICKFLY
jgi:hypothetical protein